MRFEAFGGEGGGGGGGGSWLPKGPETRNFPTRIQSSCLMEGLRFRVWGLGWGLKFRV